MFFQIVSILGAGLLLGAYAAIQRGWLRGGHPLFSMMNLAGSLLLLWVAVVDQRIGFIVLEAAWAAFSLPPLLRWGFRRHREP